MQYHSMVQAATVTVPCITLVQDLCNVVGFTLKLGKLTRKLREATATFAG